MSVKFEKHAVHILGSSRQLLHIVSQFSHIPLIGSSVKFYAQLFTQFRN